MGMESPGHGPRVLILGGGFAGIAACRELAGAECRITLIDRSNHHLFQPLLYQVATAGLSGSDVAQPIRRMLNTQKNVEVHLAEVTGVDLTKRVVTTRDIDGSSDGVHEFAEIGFDHLVIACGVETNWFGNDAWEQHAIGLKSLADAYRVRDSFIRALEQAENEPADSARRQALLTTVVIGGGPTGVEMAGALAELAKRASAKDYRRITGNACRIVLMDRDQRVLSTFDPALSDRAKRDLEGMGVEVRTGAGVDAIERGAVIVKGERLEAATVVWAAGVRAPAWTKTITPTIETDRAGRIIVGGDLRVPGFETVYAAGDIALMKDAEGKLVPGVAQGAMQSGRFVGRSICERFRGSPERNEVFRYRDKGSLATIGKRRAVAEIGKLRIAGTLAWLLWLFIHLLFLIDVRSKLTVLIKWAWAYLWYDPSGRILVDRRS
jgi:NADH dehydrogenase